MLQLKKFPDIPVSTREEARWSCPHPEEPRFLLVARDERSFHCFVRIEFPAFPSHLQGRRSQQERREELQGGATIPRVPQRSQSIPEEPVSPALPRLSCRVSAHTMVARGIALSKSPVGKPHGKASRESHRSLDLSDRKRHTSATVSLRCGSYVESTCPISRKSRRLSPPVEMRPIFSAASGGNNT